MDLQIILVGILVGIANFASRFGPFYVIQKSQKTALKSSFCRPLCRLYFLTKIIFKYQHQ